jgi:hypothetical protein
MRDDPCCTSRENSLELGNKMKCAVGLDDLSPQNKCLATNSNNYYKVDLNLTE